MAFIRDLVRQAYYDVPACALGMPAVELSIYPASGRQRIVEILLDYPLERAELEERRDDLAWELELLTRDLTAGGRTPQVTDALQVLLEEGSYDPEGGATPYDFFSAGAANSEGLSLAFAALCQELNLPCHVAQGTLEGVDHFWAVVQTGEGWRHLDPSVPEEDRRFHTDQELQELGYLWEGSGLPVCAPA